MGLHFLTFPGLFTTALDLVLVFLLIYRVLYWLKISHSLDLIKGLFVLGVFFLLSIQLQLETLEWIIEKFTAVMILLVVIIFQPELRRFLERIGSTGELFPLSKAPTDTPSTSVVKHIVRSIEFLAKEKIGAIVVIQQETVLDEYSSSGIVINGKLNSEFLTSLFWPGSPTHDGAVILQEATIKSAGCFLPLTKKKLVDRRLGSRHRAAMGVSELSDAVVIVVSEESGVISLVEEGKMTRFLTRTVLETRLFDIYQERETTLNFNISKFFDFKQVKFFKKQNKKGKE